MNHESVPALTRADVELRLAQVENSVGLDLSSQNLRHSNLSYMDLRGVNLCGADLQGANLRGINLSQADLRAANLSEVDLDGANLSRARLGENEASRVNLRHTKLSHAILTGLDLRGFDLTGLNLHQADLNGTDLRGALLHGSNLSGADLSTALLHGFELRGAILHRGGLSGNGLKRRRRGNARQQELASSEPVPLAERSSPAQEHEIGQTWKPLETRQLLLRDFAPDDVLAVHAFDADPELRRYRGGGQVSLEDTYAFIQRALQWQKEEPRPTYAFAVVLKAQAEIIGVICLTITRREWNEAELWYRLSRKHWRHGYMTEAAASILSFGFTTLHLHRIWAMCHPDNIGSWKVMEKMGMRYEGLLHENAPNEDGTWHDNVLYAITDHEWRTKPGIIINID